MLSPTQRAELTEAARMGAHFTGPFGPWLEHLVQDESMSLANTREALRGWDAIPYIDSDKGHMATLIKRNKEVHIAIFRKYRRKGNITMRRIRCFLEPILNEEIFLVTKTDKAEDSRFVERLGFERLGVDASGVTCYILNAINYSEVRHVRPIQD